MRSAEQTLSEEYRRRFEAAGEYRQQVWKVLCRDFFSKLVTPETVVLDVGCGWGEFINNIRARKKLAMDLNPDARARLSSGIEFLHQDCSAPWPLAEGSLDVVFSSNFLEHLPDKAAVERTLASAFAALKPGGKVVLLGPNVRYLAGKYWDFWDHQVAISDRSLVEMIGLAGFETTEQIARFLPYTMSDGAQPPIALVKAYLKLPMIWPVFGRQFLVVGQKPLAT